MFDPDKFYTPNDPALAALASYWTLATWRSQGRGPEFVKVGTRVFYTGEALNAWVRANTVQTAAA